MSETAPLDEPQDVLSALREQLFELRPLKLDPPRYSTLTAAARAGDLKASSRPGARRARAGIRRAPG